MNGSLVATSTIGVGSTFSLSLTLADAEQPSEAGLGDMERLLVLERCQSY